MNILRPGSPQQGKIQVRPTEFTYYLHDSECKSGRKGEKTHTWDASPVAILAVSNPTDTDISKVKVRVNHLDFLVRPPRFALPKNTKYVPLLVRLIPDFDEVKIQLMADYENKSTKNQDLQVRMSLKRVKEPNNLRAAMKVSRARRNGPVFHAKELSSDQVRLALDNTGLKSVASEFISRGIPFKKLCGITWGCCLRGKPQLGSFGFQHTETCPIIKHRGLVSLTDAGQSGAECPLCAGHRKMLDCSEGGLPYQLINVIVQYMDPLL